MGEIIKYGKFKTNKKNKKKIQIILLNSYRPKLQYLNSIKNRNNYGVEKIPNYFIDTDGNIINLLSDDSYCNMFFDNDVNKSSITICLENLGWINKKSLSNSYVNWIGDIYNGEVFIKKWRDKLYWSKYSEKQFESLVEICKKLTKKFSIKNNFIGHNTKVDGVRIFNGIVCRSNFENYYTDLSPSFDFEKFKKAIENE
jgi:N-acetyl-anhydromuramyl-L-alanine amidase AmpD